MKKLLLSVAFLSTLSAFGQTWPEALPEAKPAARWWWLGSAVDKENLSYSIAEYAKAGIGELEITPIYGVQGNEANDIPFLSEKWMEMYKHTVTEGAGHGVRIDLNTGTGWPFGGPDVSESQAAAKAIFEETDGKLTLQVGRTKQQVKRAAPGGEGLVMDHFDRDAVSHYFKKFDEAFAQSGAPAPHNFFNDSYEVYNADWTPRLLEEFAKRRGYRLEDHFAEFTDASRPEVTTRIVADYRETLSELLIENFTSNWTAWAHSHGSKTRNQAHGSPANLIDTYAAVDIPEIEGFGLSQFHIKGLRQDSLTRKNDSEISMLKYASSAAHIAGKAFTSSETFTWLTEHFRTSLSQCKPDLDLMFCSGVNHVFFHGITYSPRQAAWPGWRFYASVDMSPTNSIWRDAPAFFNYITRCQSFLQWGQPDNDFLVYLPVYDMWAEQPGRLLQFDIHHMAERAPRFIKAITQIVQSGYDVDYISDQFIRSTQCRQGQLITQGGAAYKAIIVPGAHLMPVDVFQKLISLAKQGATVVFLDNYPTDVPGYGQLAKRRVQFQKQAKVLPVFGVVAQLGKGRILSGSDYAATLALCGVLPETMRTADGLHCIRRTNAMGHHYFISSLQPKDIDGWVTLGKTAECAMIFDPMTGKQGWAEIRQQDGKTQVRLQLKSGESCILQTIHSAKSVDPDAAQPWPYYQEGAMSLSLDRGWKLSFVESTPSIPDTFDIDRPADWTILPVANASTNMGTGLYRLQFTLPDWKADDWMLDLGDVRESARVRINGKEVGCAWSVPFTLRVGEFLQPGENVLEVEVTNLPANRIAQMDRDGKLWRIFKEINVVDLNYRKTSYAHWQPLPAGLNSSVRLIPLTY